MTQGNATHQTFTPVFVSKICAVWLHPVAKYLPSCENWTQQTTLNSFKKRKEERRQFQIHITTEHPPGMPKRMNKLDIQALLNLRIKRSKPIRALLPILGRDVIKAKLFLCSLPSRSNRNKCTVTFLLLLRRRRLRRRRPRRRRTFNATPTSARTRRQRRHRESRSTTSARSAVRWWRWRSMHGWVRRRTSL